MNDKVAIFTERKNEFRKVRLKIIFDLFSHLQHQQVKEFLIDIYYSFIFLINEMDSKNIIFCNQQNLTTLSDIHR
jgi:hypothetical protein